MNVLFIDDHPEFLREMAEQLEDHGHAVTRCSQADDAIRELGRVSSYDIVVLDIMMRLGTIISEDEAPETGIAIYKRLRSAEKQLPVLVVSAMSKDRFWRDWGFSTDPHAEYFGKPLGADDKIYRLVERKL